MSIMNVRHSMLLPAFALLVAGLGLPVSGPQAVLAALPGRYFISSGGEHSCAIENGKAYCWGDNQYGQLGDGSTVNSSIPSRRDERRAIGQDLIQISADTNGTCAVDSKGAGTAGVITATASSATAASPALQCQSPSTRAACGGQNPDPVSVGDVYDTCALDSTGAAYCWGDNGSGELGNGSFTASSVPVAVDTSGVLAGKVLTQISAGGFSDDSGDHTCVLDSIGDAYSWGYGGGELGDGSSTALQCQSPWTRAACWPQSPHPDQRRRRTHLCSGQYW